MAVIGISQRTTTPFAVSVTTLTAADTLAYVKGAGHAISLNNITGSPVNVKFLGNTATTAPGPIGYGGTISLAAGYTVTVPANSTQHLVLDNISLFLAGSSVNVTGGTGCTAHVFTN
jgi:hypothetical protein